jgi:hypothetical protein
VKRFPPACGSPERNDELTHRAIRVLRGEIHIGIRNDWDFRETCYQSGLEKHDRGYLRTGTMWQGCGSSRGRGRAAGLTARRTRLPAPHPAHRPHRPLPGPAPGAARRTPATSMWQRRCRNHLAATATWLPAPSAPHQPALPAPRAPRAPPAPAPTAHSERAVPKWHPCRRKRAAGRRQRLSRRGRGGGIS